MPAAPCHRLDLCHMIEGIQELYDQPSSSGLIRMGARGMIDSCSLHYPHEEPEQGWQVLTPSL